MKKLRVVIGGLYYWPFVRRGAERVMHDVSHFMADQGHEVTILTTKPGPSEAILEGDVLVRYQRESKSRFLQSKNLTASPSAYRSLVLDRFDILHCFYPGYALAGSIYQYINKRDFRYIFHLIGPWPPSALIRHVFSRAAAIISPSVWMHDQAQTLYGLKTDVIYPPIRHENFKVSADKKPDEPIILCVASFKKKQEIILPLLLAFEQFRSHVPGARLKFSGAIDEETKQQLFDSLDTSCSNSVEVLGVGEIEALPALYAAAAFTVLPSENECFGMVLAESLAAGTPAVGPRSGGIPEIISGPDVGVLYEPGGSDTEKVQRLTEAMLKAWELSKTPGISEVCHLSSKRFGIETVGPQFEQLYDRMMSHERN